MSVENVASENTGAASTAAAEPPNAPDETLLDVALARFGEFRMHRCSRLVLAAQLHAASAAKADDLAEFVLGFLETQSKRVDVKVSIGLAV